MEIRRARPEDASGIARTHHASWHAAYKDKLPKHLLDIVQVDERESKWKERFEDPLFERCACWVAEDENEVIGFALVGPNRGASPEEERKRLSEATPVSSTAELYAIYLHPSAWGKKVGSGLMQAAVDHMRAEGYRDALVWVLESNEPAQRFYEATGWVPDGGTQDCFFGDEAPEVSYRIVL